MPSPFPGMDPYLERPSLWPDFHNRFATEISNVLNRLLPPPYYARLEMREEVAISDDEGKPRRIVADVTVSRPRKTKGGGPVGILERQRTELSESIHLEVRDEKFKHLFIEIRDPTQGHKLITLIEILSPSNKRKGADRNAYRAKQYEVLSSDAHLIEIDLLRTGSRIVPTASIKSAIAGIRPRPDYVVFISRAWSRGGCEIFPVHLRGSLPCIPIPLQRKKPEPPLDLQYIFQLTYDGGPYQRGAVDYTKPPKPPLKPDDVEWARALVRDWLTAGAPPLGQ